MPIRPELRQFYGAAHRAFRRELIAARGPVCMKCGQVRERYLNLAHVTHDPRVQTQVCLWCPSCHAIHDAPHAFAIRRRTFARRAGQLWLLPEIEFAAVPMWLVPRKLARAVIASAQGRLF